MRLTVFVIAFTLQLSAIIEVFAAIRTVPDAYETIQSAVDAAAWQDTVMLRNGIYLESVSIPCRNITLAGEFILSGDSIDITNTRWSSETERNIRISDCNESSLVRIVGLSFVGSWTSGGMDARSSVSVAHCRFDSCSSSLGGAIRTEDAEVALSNCSFHYSRSTTDGIVGYFVNSHVTFDRCEISGIASNLPNGALIKLIDGFLSVENSRLNGCHSTGDMPIIAFAGDVDSILLTSTTIDSNTFDRGFVQANGSCSNLRLTDVSFFSNTVKRGIVSSNYLSDVGRCNVTECSFLENRAAHPVIVSPMFVVGSFSDFTLEQCLFSDNEWYSVSCILGYLDPTWRVKGNYFIGNSGEPGVGWACLITLSPNFSQTFEHNVFYNNAVPTVSNPVQSTPFTLAQDNYWGDPSGPYHAELNPSGLGDTIGTRIEFIPWATDSLFSSDADEEHLLPRTFALGYPFPNPFNSSVTIEYALARDQAIRLEVHDVQGRLVSTLLEEVQAIGVHQVIWDAEGVSTGLYFARLQSMDGKQATQAVKLVLVK